MRQAVFKQIWEPTQRPLSIKIGNASPAKYSPLPKLANRTHQKGS